MHKSICFRREVEGALQGQISDRKIVWKAESLRTKAVRANSVKPNSINLESMLWFSEFFCLFLQLNSSKYPKSCITSTCFVRLTISPLCEALFLAWLGLILTFFFFLSLLRIKLTEISLYKVFRLSRDP